MNSKYLKKLKKVFQKANWNINNFWLEFDSLPKKYRRHCFEPLSYLALTVNSNFGPNVMWPEEVTSDLKDVYKLDHILSGGTSRGADAFIKKQTLIAVEFKSKDLDGVSQSLRLGKISVKDVALNSTNIRKQDRIVIHDFPADESYDTNKFLSHWTFIHIDTILDQQALDDIKNFLSNQKLPTPSPFTYRTDVIDGTYHKKQLSGIWDKICKQRAKYGNSKGLIIKPTATGKGADPILLSKKYFIPNWKSNKNQKQYIEIRINPSLAVATGNILKLVSDIAGENCDRKSVAWLSDLAPGEDVRQLKLLEALTYVPTETEFKKFIKKNSNKKIIIDTTIHSYWKLEKILAGINIEQVHIIWFDEVKHSVQDWDSIWTAGLKQKYIKADHTIGLDANIVTGEEEDGTQYQSSMMNTNVWREVYEKMDEDTAIKLGWKRRTRVVVVPWDENNLPIGLRQLIQNNKKGLVKIKGYNTAVPFTWVYNLASELIVKSKFLKHKYTLNKTNTIDRANKYTKFANAIWPKLVKAKRFTQPLEQDLLTQKFISLYDLGKNTKTRLRKLETIPKNHKRATVSQVRACIEGYDPTDAWIDSNTEADLIGSKVYRYQFIGRAQRKEKLINARLDENIVSVPMIKQADLSDEYSINKCYRQLAALCEQLHIGKDIIEDCVTFLDYDGGTGPSVGTKQKGTRVKKSAFLMSAKEWMAGFTGYVKKDTRWSPWTPMVDEIADRTKDYYITPNIGHSGASTKFYKSIVNDPKFKSFYNNFKKSTRILHTHKIRTGTFWMLSDQKEIEMKKLNDHFNSVTKPNILLKKLDIIKNTLAKLEKNIPMEILATVHQRFPITKYVTDNKEWEGRGGIVVKVLNNKFSVISYDLDPAVVQQKVNECIVLKNKIIKAKQKLHSKIIRKFLEKIKTIATKDQSELGAIFSEIAQEFKLKSNYDGPNSSGNEYVIKIIKNKLNPQQLQMRYYNHHKKIIKKMFLSELKRNLKIKNMSVIEIDKNILNKLLEKKIRTNICTVHTIRMKEKEFKKLNHLYHLKKMKQTNLNNKGKILAKSFPNRKAVRFKGKNYVSITEAAKKNEFHRGSIRKHGILLSKHHSPRIRALAAKRSRNPK